MGVHREASNRKKERSQTVHRIQIVFTIK